MLITRSWSQTLSLTPFQLRLRSHETVKVVSVMGLLARLQLKKDKVIHNYFELGQELSTRVKNRWKQPWTHTKCYSAQRSTIPLRTMSAIDLWIRCSREPDGRIKRQAKVTRTEWCPKQLKYQFLGMGATSELSSIRRPKKGTYCKLKSHLIQLQGKKTTRIRLIGLASS